MKRCLAIVYMTNGRAANVINRLRRKYDEMTAAAIDAHVTLAGSCNTALAVSEVATVVAHVTSEVEPFELTITGADTFLPISPTCFLRIEPQEQLAILHNNFVAQLSWEEVFPNHSHVTITEYISLEDTSKMACELHTLNIHETDTLNTVTLLQKNSDGKWMLLREFQLEKIR